MISLVNPSRFISPGPPTYDVWDTSLDFVGGISTRILTIKSQDINDVIATGEFSLIANFKVDSFETTDTLFCCWQTGGGGNRSIWVRMRSSGSAFQVFTSSTGSSTGGLTSFSHSLSTGTWYQMGIRVSMSEAVANDRVQIHIDGVKQTTTTGSGNHSGGIHAVDYTTDGYHYNWGGRKGAGNSLNGDMHEWTILDTPLSTSDFLTIWNSGTPISPRDNHNANVVSRIDSDSGTWNISKLDFDFDDEILGTGIIETETYSSGEESAGVLDSSGGIY